MAIGRLRVRVIDEGHLASADIADDISGRFERCGIGAAIDAGQRAAERQIAELERQMKTGEIFPKSKQPSTLTSDRLDAAKAKPAATTQPEKLPNKARASVARPTTSRREAR